MKRKLTGVILVIILGVFIAGVALFSGARSGTDDKVMNAVGTYAQEVGIKEKAPIFNFAKGDSLLFLFAFGGGVAGFWIGYNCRDLFGKNQQQKP